MEVLLPFQEFQRVRDAINDDVGTCISEQRIVIRLVRRSLVRLGLGGRLPALRRRFGFLVCLLSRPFALRGFEPNAGLLVGTESRFRQ